jgi:hypothetical protein
MWYTWQLFASTVYVQNRKPLSPRIHSVEACKWTSTYSVRRISRWRRKFSSVCASISVSVLGKNGAETYEMLQAYFGESCLSRSKTFEWYSSFQNGRRSYEDDPRLDRPSTSHTEETVARVQEIICADRRLTIREVAEDVGIAFGTCQKILCADIALRSGVPANGSCIMTMLLLTELSPQVTFCQNTTFRPSHTLPTPWPCSMRLLLVPVTEENNERSPVRWHWGGAGQRDETNEGHYKKWLSEVLSSVVGTLE